MPEDEGGGMKFKPTRDDIEAPALVSFLVLLLCAL